MGEVAHGFRSEGDCRDDGEGGARGGFRARTRSAASGSEAVEHSRGRKRRAAGHGLRPREARERARQRAHSLGGDARQPELYGARAGGRAASRCDDGDRCLWAGRGALRIARGASAVSRGVASGHGEKSHRRNARAARGCAARSRDGVFEVSRERARATLRHGTRDGGRFGAFRARRAGPRAASDDARGALALGAAASENRRTSGRAPPRFHARLCRSDVAMARCRKSAARRGRRTCESDRDGRGPLHQHRPGRGEGRRHDARGAVVCAGRHDARSGRSKPARQTSVVGRPGAATAPRRCALSRAASGQWVRSCGGRRRMRSSSEGGNRRWPG